MNFSASIRHRIQSPSSLYLHYPVCKHTCSYCDFNVYSTQKLPSYTQTYIDGLGAHLSNLIEPGEPLALQTIYMGGGTPSLIDTDGFHALCDMLSSFFDFRSVQEWTIEANPESVDRDKVAAWKARGVNRVSVGIQTTVPHQLKRLERLATRLHIDAAVEAVRDHFDNFSIDLMMGIPDQSLDSLQADLKFIAALQPPHVSVYILTLAADHIFFKSQMMSSKLANPEQIESFYSHVCRFMGDLGYEHYEVSSFAKQNKKSLHNSNYWDLSSSYLGIGPGAHSFLRQGSECMRAINISDPAGWASHLNGIESFEVLSADQLRLEAIYLALRKRAWIPIHDLDTRQLTAMHQAGWIELDAERLRVTESGWLLVESIAERLV